MSKRKWRRPCNKKKFLRSRRKVRTSRDYKSPEYVKWRQDVKERDNYMCQWPGCLSRKQIQVHHIKTWSKHPGMRFVLANGITLCRRCHESIKGKEHDYESFFLKILEWQLLAKIKDYNKRRL